MGSLKRVLQDRLGLVESLETTYAMTSAGTNFYIVVALSGLGVKHTRIVLDVIFLYLTVLRQDGVNMDLYDSIRDLVQLKWDWAEPDELMDTASGLAERMTRLPAEKLLSGDALIEKPDPEKVADLLERLRPGNLNVGYVDPNATASGRLNASAARELPHYGVKYAVQNISERFPGAPTEWSYWLQTGSADAARAALLSRMQAAGLVSPGEVSVEASESPFPVPPGPIEGVPKEISEEHMHAEIDELRLEATLGARRFPPLFGPRPQKLEAGLETGMAQASVWFRSGWVTSSPKVSIRCSLRPLRAKGEPELSALDAMRLTLYERLLGEEMQPKLVDLTLTGVAYETSVSSDGLIFSFGGFAPTLPRLVDTVLGELNRFNANSSLTLPSRFGRVVQEVREELTTWDKMPVEYAVEDKNLLLTFGYISRAEQLARRENNGRPGPGVLNNGGSERKGQHLRTTKSSTHDRLQSNRMWPGCARKRHAGVCRGLRKPAAAQPEARPHGVRRRLSLSRRRPESFFFVGSQSDRSLCPGRGSEKEDPTIRSLQSDLPFTCK